MCIRWDYWNDYCDCPCNRRRCPTCDGKGYIRRTEPRFVPKYVPVYIPVIRPQRFDSRKWR